MLSFQKKWAFILTLLVAGFLSNDSLAQCSSLQNYVSQSESNIPNGYTFLKSYPLDGKEGARPVIEHSYIFSKDANYNIALANHQYVKVEIFNSQRKLLSFSQHNGKNYPSITYKSRATGIYYLKFTFNNRGDYCAAATLSFRR